MAKIIEVKCLPEYFEAARVGIKPWELRYDDRNYAVGDLLIMREWKDGKYTGRRLHGQNNVHFARLYGACRRVGRIEYQAIYGR